MPDLESVVHAKKNWRRRVCVRVQSKPMSYTEIREEHRSVTFKPAVVSRRERKCLICFFLYCPPSLTLTTMCDFSSCAVQKQCSDLSDLWATMSNTNLYDWLMRAHEILLHFSAVAESVASKDPPRSRLLCVVHLTNFDLCAAVTGSGQATQTYATSSFLETLCGNIPRGAGLYT